MAFLDDEIVTLLKGEIFQAICNNDIIKITQLNAVISLLIKANIDFSLSFTSGTRASEPCAELQIYINPNTTVNFTFEFDC